MRHRIEPFALKVSAASAVALFAVATFASAADLSPQEKKLIPLAKQEGAVTIINPIFSDATSTRMAKAFKERYGLGDAFQFNNLRKGTGATVAQVRQEMQAGRFTVDVHLVSDPGFFAAAAKRGAYEKLDSAYWKNHTELVEKAGQYSNYPYVVVPLAYTFQPIWNSSCPGMENFNVTSYSDVLASSLKGKTIASDLTKSATYTNTTIALTEAGINMKGIFTQLKATDPLIEFRTEPKMQLVISCERPLDMWNLSGRAYQNVLKKPELAKALKIGYYKEGQVMLGNQAAVLKGAPHPNAGKLLIEFLLSKEGTDIFVEIEALYTFMKGYQPPAAAAPYLLDLSQHKLLGLKDWIAARKKFKPVRSDWTKMFK
ncbi:MAG: substrate-binding domain-containing protein [Gammaproteobacteria bacterium]|nr:substrate-binding domain-containing protein [Gammaproteobacteria bacterium]